MRTLADVFLPDGSNVNHTLVKGGVVLAASEVALEDTVLEGLETEAQEG